MEVKIEINVKVQYLITGDVNWLNAAAGSVLPGKAGYLGSPVLSEISDVSQNVFIRKESFNLEKSVLKVGAGYVGSLSGFGAGAVSSDWSSFIGSFIFSSGVQSFQTNTNTQIINSEYE